MIYTCREFPDNMLDAFPILPRRSGHRSGKNKRTYINCVAAFDIETTRISDDYSVMYIWQLQIGLSDTIIGRNWHEFKITLTRLKSQLPDGAMLVILVHNLAFEFQFLRGLFKFEPDDVFLTGPRRPLRVDLLGSFELRCSYLHSNMRLETYLEKMGVPDKKLSYDYEKKRYPWTPLTPAELEYCIHDVKGLVEAYMVEMQHDGDDLYTVPLTSTGYVRRDVKRVMYRHRSMIREIVPDIEIYSMLREAFRGGDTHANRFYAGIVVPAVYSYDRSSSYPDVQLNRPFPVGPFRRRTEKTWEELWRLINVRKRAILCRVAFWDIKLRDVREGFPYLTFDKSRRVYGERLDNGRILSAEYLEVTLTDIDLKIVVDQYDFKARRVLDLYYARYGPLPEDLRNVVKSYYKAKTELKGVPGQELMYGKSKNKLNSVYGMSAQNPVKRSIRLVNGRYEEDDTPIEQLLEETNRRAFFAYQWGVFTTAWARFELYRGRKNVTDQGGVPVYQDTDSVKYISDRSIDWDRLNAGYIAASTESGAYADDPKGKRHYMGVYEPDKGYPAAFATRGAKKYAVDHDGVIEATISGVSKRDDGGRVSGGMELQAAGGLRAFLEPEFVFRDAGGIELRYNDEDRFMERIDGHRIKIRESVTIIPSTYTLHDTEEYADLLTEARGSIPILSLEAVREYMFDTFGKRF